MDREEQSKKVKAAYERVFATDDGQVLLEDLIVSTGLMGASLDYKAPDALKLAYNDGAKSIVCRIIQNVSMTPQEFMGLMNVEVAEPDAKEIIG